MICSALEKSNLGGRQCPSPYTVDKWPVYIHYSITSSSSSLQYIEKNTEKSYSFLLDCWSQGRVFSSSAQVRFLQQIAA